MEVCFIEKTINDFLKEQIGEKQGAVINEAGELLSQHKGLWFYTIGQRKGILLSKGPYYVLGKDIKKNILIVTKNERKLYKKRMVAKGLNWILGEKPKLPLKVKAKIRYRQRAENAKIFWDSKLKSYLIEFNKAQRAITPGQSVVFYSLDSIVSGQAKQGGAVNPTKKKSGQLDRASRVLGGAIIKKAL